ncbi:acetylornithine deacetylase [Oceanibium sediminis]|uniref:acetylornithine deacetylase n=1 Tax=Oceanibium sediminis TaxID=2026339 RepID=UPI000DD41323|nr:acetylornithine deacetylase [Oceanibium sediminis]
MNSNLDLSSVDHLRALVGFDTVSHRSNLLLIDYLERVLEPLGARLERIEDGTGQKANLLASFGPTDRAGYILSGHTDVVPVDGQTWSTEPFELTERDGKLFGRGTTDMKGFLACCLAMAPKIAAAPLKAPLHIAFSYDEEVGCLGVRDLIARLDTWDLRPLGCFVGEPTSMQIVTSHKAKRAFRGVVTGTPGHSSRAPSFVNAVDFAAEFLVELRRLGIEIQQTGQEDAMFDVPFTTTHVGLIEGGKALNIVPEHCHFEFEFRALPNDDVDAMVAHMQRFVEVELLPRMKALSPDARFRLENIISYPGLDTAPGEDIVVLAKKLARQNGHGKVAYGTEGGRFSKEGGIPTVVCGPGDIERAHKADEYITRKELAACEAFIGDLIAHLSR